MTNWSEEKAVARPFVENVVDFADCKPVIAWFRVGTLGATHEVEFIYALSRA